MYNMYLYFFYNEDIFLVIILSTMIHQVFYNPILFVGKHFYIINNYTKKKKNTTTIILNRPIWLLL